MSQYIIDEKELEGTFRDLLEIWLETNDGKNFKPYNDLPLGEKNVDGLIRSFKAGEGSREWYSHTTGIIPRFGGVDWKSFPDNLTDYIIKLPWNDAKFHLCSLLRAYPTKAAINQLRDVLMSDFKNVKKLRDYSLSEFKKYSKVRTTHRQEQTVCK